MTNYCVSRQADGILTELGAGLAPPPPTPGAHLPPGYPDNHPVDLSSPRPELDYRGRDPYKPTGLSLNIQDGKSAGDHWTRHVGGYV